MLNRVHYQAAVWISGAFKTSPTFETQSLAGLMPMHLHLRKLYIRSTTRAFTLDNKHPLVSDAQWLNPNVTGSHHKLTYDPNAKTIVKDIHTMAATHSIPLAHAEPFHVTRTPGNRISEVCSDQIVWDTPSKSDNDDIEP